MIKIKTSITELGVFLSYFKDHGAKIFSLV